VPPAASEAVILDAERKSRSPMRKHEKRLSVLASAADAAACSAEVSVPVFLGK
jgi:hypothetical protein